MAGKPIIGQTLTSTFMTTARANATKVALRWQQGEAWNEWTWQDYADRAAQAAAGLKAMGVGKGDRIVLMMRNRPEFHVADVATMLCGASPVSIYNSSSPEQTQYLVNHCEAKVAIVEDGGFLDRIMAVRSGLPKLEHIVVIEMPDKPSQDLTPFSELVGTSPVDLDEACALAGPNDIATIIYTSGTTGPPKGVVISHSNLCSTISGILGSLPKVGAGTRSISFLPMAHIAERMVTHYLPMGYGGEVTTCPDPALLSQYLGNVHPNVFLGVPRVWEKIYAGIQAVVSGDPEKKASLDQALQVSAKVYELREKGEPIPDELQAGWEKAEAEGFSLLRGLVGLDAVEYALTGAAPIPREVFNFFLWIGVPISEVYGLSESSGVITWEVDKVRPGTVGRKLPGLELRLGDDGEVLARGPGIFQGYLNDPEKTAEAIDSQGWLHTGDIGVLDEDGYLKIVDRKKELIITAGGKNISPANIEAALKSGALISQVCVIGDNRPFMSALLTLDTEVLPVWAAQHGIEETNMAALCAHPEVIAQVEKEVSDANAHFSRVEQIKKFVILSEEWVPDSEELTPTMKLKRRGVAEKYADKIENMYA